MNYLIKGEHNSVNGQKTIVSAIKIGHAQVSTIYTVANLEVTTETIIGIKYLSAVYGRLMFQ